MYVCSFLGEALRAILVLEMRTLTVSSTAACERVPAHLPPGCTALRATLRSCSGAQATVVLGGPRNGEWASGSAMLSILKASRACLNLPQHDDYLMVHRKGTLDLPDVHMHSTSTDNFPMCTDTSLLWRRSAGLARLRCDLIWREFQSRCVQL